MVIGIDIDNTITNTHTTTMKYLAQYDKSCLDWHTLPYTKQAEFLTLYSDNILSECSLKDYVSEALNYLHNNGYKLIFITARSNRYSPNITTITQNYFAKYNIPYDDLIFNADYNTSKGEIAHQNKVSLFIDDKEENLDTIAKYNIECLKFISPNSKKSSSKYKTFTNWHDIIEYIDLRKD